MRILVDVRRQCVGSPRKCILSLFALYQAVVCQAAMFGVHGITPMGTAREQIWVLRGNMQRGDPSH
jgi:hypothetical protein